MPTLTAGRGASFNLPTGSTISASGNGEFSASHKGGQTKQPIRATAQVYGPFDSVAAVDIQAIGSVTYDVIAASSVAALTTAQVAALGARFLASRLQSAANRASMNNPFDLGVMASPPTITSPNVDPSPKRQTGYWATNGKSQFDILGATDLVNFVIPYATNYIAPQGCRTAAGVYQNAVCSFSVDFVTDAPNFAFEFFEGVTNAMYMAIGTPQMTDMRLTSASGHTASGSPGGFTVDWSGVRKLRGYRVYMVFGQRFGRINIGESDTLYRPAIVRPRILDIGDSITASTMSPTANGYYGPVTVAREVSGCDIVGHGIGASGYIAGNKLRNAWRIEDAASAYAAGLDLIRLHLGINDVGSSQAAIKDEAMLALAALRSVVGTTPIEVKGPYGGARNADAGILGVEAGLQEAVAALGDSRMIYTPTVTASNSVWPETLGVTDTDTSAGAAGNSRFITGNDNIHPSIYGAEYYGRRRWLTTLAAVAAAGW